jgi:REP element-mobilizing transposase RayT
MRKNRCDYEGAKHHVTSRVMADLVRFTPQEHAFIELVLAEAVEKYPIRLHAQCIMPNHFHLIIESVEKALSAFMKTVKQRIAQFINRTRRRSGPVFQQRFHNVIIQGDEQWMQTLAYVHLNPVPSVVSKPSAYRWSSHRAYAGEEEPPDWLTTEDMLASFGSTEALLEYVEVTRATRARQRECKQAEPARDRQGEPRRKARRRRKTSSEMNAP